MPGVGRFISADTIVPNPANPQSYNRFSYTRNNPINRIDPTGHLECEFDDNCGPPVPIDSAEPTPDTRPLEVWELLALMETVYAESQDGSYPEEMLIFLAWSYLNRISSGKWADMGEAVYSGPPVGYDDNGNPIFPAAQSAIGYLWLQEQDSWTPADIQHLVESVWKNRQNPNWSIVEDVVEAVYKDWLQNGPGSANDPTNGGYNYASLTKKATDMSREEYDALVVERVEYFQTYANNNPGFKWGYTTTIETSGLYVTFFSANDPCGYTLHICGLE